jgi:membrane protease YdiL (CAAX protease family)
LTAFVGVPIPETNIPPLILGLANAGIVLVVYGLLGLAGYWFARILGLPGTFSDDGNLRRWFLIPLAIGIVGGVLLIVGDLIFAQFNGYGRFPHPAFPASFLASLSAGIGEEIAFRGFVLGLWGFILNWLFKRFNGRTAALWIANIIAALAFGAGHLGFVFLMTGASTLAEVNPVLLVEVFLLNGLIGLLAGERYMKDGLVAAAGVHFWADVVFHVMWDCSKRSFTCRHLFPCSHRPKAKRKWCVPIKPSWTPPYKELTIPTSFGETHVIASGPENAPPVVLIHVLWLVLFPGIGTSGPQS